MLGIENPMQPIDLNWLFNNTQNLNIQAESNVKSNVKQSLIQETKNKKQNTKEIQKKQLKELYDDMKLNDLDFHSMQTFKNILKDELNIDYDKQTNGDDAKNKNEENDINKIIDEILKQNESKIRLWIEKNKTNGGFVYQTQNTKQRDELKYPPVRCDLCKFYGHLSHTCTIKELAFKLNNSVLRNNACRCHICGMLGHSAESGLCPFIICSFCYQNGHWNFMCPHKDKISRTNCTRCLKYGHRLEQCPEQWRQFDRISSYEQTTFKDPSLSNKNVYCYQCAQKGHYGYNCPEFYRKYFIRDYHHMDNNPVYYFASASPFIKQEQELNDIDVKIINELQDKLIDERLFIYLKHSESINLLNDFELYQQQQLQNSKTKESQIKNDSNATSYNTNDINNLLDSKEMNINDVNNQLNIQLEHIFNDTHWLLPLKEYIRKISNWVIDVHWILILKYFIDTLPTHKLNKFIQKYPTLDNFILNWMYYSYEINNNLEQYTKDPFSACGTMPWLLTDYESRLNTAGKSLFYLLNNSLNQTYAYNIFKQSQLLNQQNQKQESRYFQYNEYTIKLINSLLFPNESQLSTSLDNHNGLLNKNNGIHLNNRHKIQSECLLFLTTSNTAQAISTSQNELSTRSDDDSLNSCSNGILFNSKNGNQLNKDSKRKKHKRSKSCDALIQLNYINKHNSSKLNDRNQISKTAHNSPMVSSSTISSLLWKKTASELKKLKETNSFLYSLNACDTNTVSFGNDIWDTTNDQDKTVTFDLGAYDIRDDLIEKRRTLENLNDSLNSNGLHNLEERQENNVPTNENTNLINIMNLLKTSESESETCNDVYNNVDIDVIKNESTNALKSLLKINTNNSKKHQESNDYAVDNLNRQFSANGLKQNGFNRYHNNNYQNKNHYQHNRPQQYHHHHHHNNHQNKENSFFNNYSNNNNFQHNKHNNNGTNGHRYTNNLHINTNSHNNRISNGLASASSSSTTGSSSNHSSSQSDNSRSNTSQSNSSTTNGNKRNYSSQNYWNYQNNQRYNSNNINSDRNQIHNNNNNIGSNFKKNLSYNDNNKFKKNNFANKKHHSSHKY